MGEKKGDRKRGPGRAPRPVPERVPATPEELAHVLVTTPPKAERQPKEKPDQDSRIRKK